MLLSVNKKTRKKFFTFVGSMLLAVSLVFGMLAGCTGTPAKDAETSSNAGTPDSTAVQTPGKYTFTDDLGVKITVENPQRVVACMGSFANIWELSGGKLVGAVEDEFDTYGLDRATVATVGTFADPSLELIIDLDPDFVIMTAAATGRDGAANQSDLRETLEACGITVAYFNVTVFEDYLKMLRTCCNITGRDDLYDLNGAAIEKKINDIKASVVTGDKAPTVLLMTTFSDGARVQDSKTMTGTMLAELGANNLADANPSLLRDFSLESVIDLNPDFILVVPRGNDSTAAMANFKAATEGNPAWATLDAVKNGRFHTLDIQFFSNKPNNKWNESYQTLYDILYA